MNPNRSLSMPKSVFISAVRPFLSFFLFLFFFFFFFFVILFR